MYGIKFLVESDHKHCSLILGEILTRHLVAIDFSGGKRNLSVLVSAQHKTLKWNPIDDKKYKTLLKHYINNILLGIYR